MNRPKKINDEGMTLVELLAALAITGAVLVGASALITHSMTYFRRSTVRSQVQSDALMTMSTMGHLLQEGAASTVRICQCGQTACTPTCGFATANPSIPPYSRIEFTLARDPNTLYAFYFLNGKIQMSVTPPGQVTTLASNATSLIFMQDPLDPTAISVTLRLNANSGGAQSETMLLSNQSVHMVSP